MQLCYERALEVRGHGHADDLDRFGLQVVLLHEVLAAQDGRTGTVGGGAALELGERVVDHRRLQDVGQGVLVLELRVGVVTRHPHTA